MRGFGRRRLRSLVCFGCVLGSLQCRGGRSTSRLNEEDPASEDASVIRRSRGTIDVFGIRKLYPSAPGGRLWTSEHWSGSSYILEERIDPRDPFRMSGMRGRGELKVIPPGELVMRGQQPRLYIYPASKGALQNVEVTVYYRRVEDTAVPHGGAIIGIRSGPEGHARSPCEAHTYYARLRHDGAADYAKELMHPSSTARARVERATPVFRSGLPYGRWVGWKLVAYNMPGKVAVKFESYLDLTEGRNGGQWTLVNETVDEGGWFSRSSCPKHAPVGGRSDHVYLGGGATLIRNTDVIEARYRWLTVREIAADQAMEQPPNIR